MKFSVGVTKGYNLFIKAPFQIQNVCVKVHNQQKVILLTFCVVENRWEDRGRVRLHTSLPGRDAASRSAGLVYRH